MPVLLPLKIVRTVSYTHLDVYKRQIALWVAAGYGVGVSAQSRIEHAQGWGIHTRPLSDGPYEIVTHLQRPCGQADVVSERFERRALQVAKNAPT